MKNKEEHCGNLFERYQELKAKTKIETSDMGASGKYGVNINFISPKDMNERYKVEEELEECLEFLSDDQLKAIYEDDELDKLRPSLTEKAIKISADRERSKK